MTNKQEDDFYSNPDNYNTVHNGTIMLEKFKNKEGKKKMTTNNKFLARGIAIVDDKKVFVIGYAVEVNEKWYIANTKQLKRLLFDLHGYHEMNESFFTKVISEPDQFVKTINGIDIFENDIVNYKYMSGSGREMSGKYKATNTPWGDTASVNYSEEVIGNTYGIADGIKEGE